MPKNSKPAAKKKSGKKGRSGYIAAIIVNFVLLFIFNSLPNWNLSFLTLDYSGVLWAINLSIGATIIANFLFIFFDAGWFKHLAQVITSVIALFVVFLIYSVYPFTFEGEPWSQWVKISLIIVMAGIGIAIIVEAFKLILRKD
ncbi:MAG: hypothetical protein JW967_04795 [Dehalococcoidales bacterium]|nr:hypothetical protein [Dehalococcoidales bacterium]